MIGAASEVIWGKKGEIKGPKKAVPGIQSVAGQSKMIVKEAKPVPGGRTRRLQSSALEAIMKAMSSWCPISEVVVKRSITLKILDHSPWSIWPYLPPQINSDGTKDSRGADRPGYNPKRGFEIQVVDGSNQPVKEEGVKIFTTFSEGSGGHQHRLGEPTLPQGIKQGVLYGQKRQGNPLTLLTDQEGFAVVDSFIASQVSGKYLVTAWLASDATVMDTVNLEVKVPGLVNFRDLIVFNERPFLFLQSDEGKANHPSNTWCTTETGNNLLLAILDFYEWTRTAEGGGRVIQTSINDMSLVWGGLFDLRADWNVEHPSHSFHRVGLSADVNMGAMNQDQLEKLTKYVFSYGGVRHRERPQIHYGFNGGN